MICFIFDDTFYDRKSNPSENIHQTKSFNISLPTSKLKDRYTNSNLITLASLVWLEMLLKRVFIYLYILVDK